jgi:hypothetical protein
VPRRWRTTAHAARRERLGGDAAEAAQSPGRGDTGRPGLKLGGDARRDVVVLDRGRRAGAVQPLREHGAGPGTVVGQPHRPVAVPGGDNTFTYFLDPHGNTVEYTTELECLDEDTWHPHVYDFSQPEVTDQWGTANPMNELVAKESFNDPDRGVFVAPPV